MTTIFKNYKLLLFACLLLMVSCSDDTSNNNEDENNIITQYKFPKKITYTDQYWGTVNIEFAYINNLLVKENDFGELNYFEHNTEGKIILIKECSEQNLEDIYLDTYECENFYSPKTFQYNNGKLSQLLDNLGNILVSYDYDEEGNLVSDDANSEYSEDLYYSYGSDGNILTKTVTYQSNVASIYTYEYDNNKNPFYSLWNEFSYYESLTFPPYNSIATIFKQNPIKVYRNNNLILEVNYIYDSDGYPLSCGYTEHLNNGDIRQGSVTFTYDE